MQCISWHTRKGEIPLDLKPFLQNKWLVMLGVLGLALILFGSLWNKPAPTMSTLGQATNTPSSETAQGVGSLNGGGGQDPVLSMESTYDKQLTNMVDLMDGVYGAVVMVTLDSTNQLNVANNVKHTTQSQKGTGQSLSQSNTTETDVFTQNENGNTVPFVTAQQSPTVRGVLVLVDAKDFYVAKAQIIDAIGHVLDVPAYKISVEPKRSNP